MPSFAEICVYQSAKTSSRQMFCREILGAGYFLLFEDLISQRTNVCLHLHKPVKLSENNFSWTSVINNKKIATIFFLYKLVSEQCVLQVPPSNNTV